MRCECPSGLVVDLRRMKGSELVSLSEQADGGMPALIDRVVGACWTETVDPGPYPFVQAGPARPSIQRLLSGDVLSLYIFLRRISLIDGDDYSFPTRCEGCGFQFSRALDLSKLPMLPLPEESAAKLREQRNFETTLADGRVVVFELGTLKQQREIHERLRQEHKKGRVRTETLVDSLAAQVVSIEGTKPDFHARLRTLLNLELGELYELRDTIRDADCGLDGEVDVQCPSCHWEGQDQIPFGRRFWDQKSSKRTRRQAETEPSAHGTPSSSETSSDAD